MKRTTISLVIVATATLLCLSCTKPESTQNGCTNLINRVIPLDYGSKTAEYLLTINVGHLYTDCGGRCITINGKQCHFDCMGNGHVCNRATSVVMQQSGSFVTATTTDTFDLTSDDFFLMPDRSLNYTDENNNRIYLNIPEQLVWRDTATLQFTFTGLTFSTSPLYTNN